MSSLSDEDFEADFALMTEIGEELDARLTAEGIQSHIIYSADPADLDSIPIPGKVQVLMKKNEYWGGEWSEEYRSNVMEDPTLYQILKRVTQGIFVTRDDHHVFYESMDLEINEDVTIIKPSMGS